MASKGALVLPAGVTLQLEEGALSIQHQGDIVIEGVPAQPLHAVSSEKGNVRLCCPEALSLHRVTAPAGTVSIAGKVTLQSIEAKAVEFGSGALKISVINAAKSIALNGAKIEADVVLAPKVDIAAGLKGRASAIECDNELGPHKLRGGFNLSEFVSLMPTGAAILRAHGINVPASEDELDEDDEEPEPAPEAAEPEPEPESEPADDQVEAAPAEPEADEDVDAVPDAIALEASPLEEQVSDAPAPQEVTPEPLAEEPAVEELPDAEALEAESAVEELPDAEALEAEPAVEEPAVEELPDAEALEAEPAVEELPDAEALEAAEALADAEGPDRAEEVIAAAPTDEIEEVIEAAPAEEIEEVIEAAPAEEIEEVIEAASAEEIEEVIEAAPAEEIEEVIEAAPAEEAAAGTTVPGGLDAQLREIVDYMGGAYPKDSVPEPIQRLFGYIDGNDLDGLRANLNPLWKDLFKEVQSTGGFHANAVSRSFRAIRELLGPTRS